MGTYTAIAVSIMATILLVPMATAGNEDITFVLHAVQTDLGPCNLPDPCLSGNSNIEVTDPGELHAIYLIIRNYIAINGLRCAFDWGPDWEFIYGSWACFPGWFTCEQTPSGPGPSNGALNCFFDCLKGGSLIAGRMSMIPRSNCISIIDPFGSSAAVVNCKNQVTEVSVSNRGRICVGPGGYDACDPAPVPVKQLTWGRIKAQYGD